ncbi:MAG: hypothetical protein Q9207_002423, partial [Kuettlingeria erythrocarpa]
IDVSTGSRPRRTSRRSRLRLALHVKPTCPPEEPEAEGDEEEEEKQDEDDDVVALHLWLEGWCTRGCVEWVEEEATGVITRGLVEGCEVPWW